MKLFDEHGNRLHDAVLTYGLLLVVIAGLLVFGSIIGLAIANGTSLDHVSGAWMALAMDLRDGVFYRPMFDVSTGYGGTRFFPLYFSLIALVSSVFDSPITAGHVVAVASGLLLLISCYLFMRRSDVKPIYSLALCVLLLSGYSIQFGFQSFRGDILPLALNILGLVVYIDKRLGKKSLYLAVLFFVLAFATKITAIHGVATLFVWLVLNGRRQEGVKILLFTILGYFVFLGLFYAGTSGRVYEIFKICAAGGTSLVTLLKAPIKFSYTIASYGQTGLLLVFWAVTLYIYRYKSIGFSLPAVFFGISLILTVGLFGSPGIELNHLVDITAAAILLIASAGFSANVNNVRSSVTLYMVLMIFIISKSLWNFSTRIDQYASSTQRFPEQLVTLVKDSKGIILSEDPALPVLNGKNPFLLDSFMLRLAILKDNDIKESVIKDISSLKFEAVVFQKDPKKHIDWYSNSHFGDVFMSNIFEYYQESDKIGGYVIYRPIL